jgi:hypothetical protein
VKSSSSCASVADGVSSHNSSAAQNNIIQGARLTLRSQRSVQALFQRGGQ